MVFSDMKIIPNFVKIDQLVQNSDGGHKRHGDVSLLSSVRIGKDKVVPVLYF
jgi:hypothetical protein